MGFIKPRFSAEQREWHVKTLWYRSRCIETAKYFSNKYPCKLCAMEVKLSYLKLKETHSNGFFPSKHGGHTTLPMCTQTHNIYSDRWEWKLLQICWQVLFSYLPFKKLKNISKNLPEEKRNTENYFYTKMFSRMGTLWSILLVKYYFTPPKS